MADTLIDHAKAQLSPMELRVFEAIERAPRPPSMRDLAGIVYGDQEGGGPEWALTAIGVHLHRLRKKIAASGYAVERGGFRIRRIGVE